MSGGTGKDDEIMPEIFSFSIIFDASFISGLQQYFISSGYAKNSSAHFARCNEKYGAGEVVL